MFCVLKLFLKTEIEFSFLVPALTNIRVTKYLY